MVTTSSLHLPPSIPPLTKLPHTGATLCPSDVLGKPGTDTGEWLCILWEPQLKSVGYLLLGVMFSTDHRRCRQCIGNADPVWLFLQGLKKQGRYIFSDPQGHITHRGTARGSVGEPGSLTLSWRGHRLLCSAQDSFMLAEDAPVSLRLY